MNDEQKRLTIYLANRSPARLAFLSPVLFHHEPRIEKHEHGGVKINTVLPQIAGVL